MADITNFPALPSDHTNLDALFANGINLVTAASTIIQRYVAYRFQQYSDCHLEDYSLWNVIQIDFEDFEVEHFNKLNGKTWSVLRDYCYTHGFWINHNFGPGRT